MASKPDPPALPIKTTAAVAALGTTYHRLIGLIRFGKIGPPEKDISGDYLWTPGDLERARQALAIDLRLKAHRRPKGNVTA
jgi:hypothetical protein